MNPSYMAMCKEQ